MCTPEHVLFAAFLLTILVQNNKYKKYMFKKLISYNHIMYISTTHTQYTQIKHPEALAIHGRIKFVFERNRVILIELTKI